LCSDLMLLSVSVVRSIAPRAPSFMHIHVYTLFCMFTYTLINIYKFMYIYKHLYLYVKEGRKDGRKEERKEEIYMYMYVYT
jgi:hypothetical protein